jgi:hypothetical protein
MPLVDLWIDPHRGRAAAHLGRVGLERVGHRLEAFAEIDQQAISVLGLDEAIFLEDVGEGREAGHVPTP